MCLCGEKEKENISLSAEEGEVEEEEEERVASSSSWICDADLFEQIYREILVYIFFLKWQE